MSLASAMHKSRKNHLRIDTTTSTDEIFALLDNVNSDNEDMMKF